MRNHRDPVRYELAAILLLSLYPVTLPAGSLLGARYLDKAEAAVIAETNLVRANPARYAKYLEDYAKRHVGKNRFKLPGRGLIQTKEGLKAVNEAVEALRKAKPVKALKPSKGLSLAAKDHAEDIGPKGLTGHDGSDGSTSEERVSRYGKWLKTTGENIAFLRTKRARDIVIQLLIDDGVPSRGHRANILNPEYGVMGVAIGRHKVYGFTCVMDYAGGYTESVDRQRNRK